MLAYSTYSEAGGVGKTTTAANLAVAHARAGLSPLIVPLDPQDGDLSRLLGVDDQRDSDEVDTLTHHLVERPKGSFDNLVRTVEHGVDIVPEHNNLSKLDGFLRRRERDAEEFGEAWNSNVQLQRVLREAGVPDRYDVLICDPPATEGPHLYNAINATRSLVLPVEPSAKGAASIRGLENLVDGLEHRLEMEVGVLAAVPIRYKDTRDQREMLEEIEYPVPEVFGERASLMEGCWKQQCSAFTYVREHRNKLRDYEQETLAQFDRLARYLETEAGIEAPRSPEPGSLEVLEA
jgi:cellulose biosynthesis protein BcsQ